MGTDGKYGRITTQYGDIPDGEPVFVFRARDRMTGPLLISYMKLCAEGGSPPRHLELVAAARERFLDWQKANPDKVRTPDSERSREWLA